MRGRNLLCSNPEHTIAASCAFPTPEKWSPLAGWLENVREVGANFAFLVLRDFYGTTQVVVETEEMMQKVKGINKESTVTVTGTVRERASKNPKLPTGDIEVAPTDITVLGKCYHNALPL